MNNQNMFKLVSYFSYDPCQITVNAVGEYPEQVVTIPHGARLDLWPDVEEGSFVVFGCLHQASDGKDPDTWKTLDGQAATPMIMADFTTQKEVDPDGLT